MPTWLKTSWRWVDSILFIGMGLGTLVQGGGQINVSTAAGLGVLGFGLENLIGRYCGNRSLGRAFLTIGWIALVATIYLIYRSWR